MVALSGCSCESDVPDGEDAMITDGDLGPGSRDARVADGSPGDAEPAGADLGPDSGEDGGSEGECRVALCAGMVSACGDCLDGDGDGLVDADDPDCLSACGRSESRFDDVFPENPPNCWRDCAFDGNHSPGDDGCSASRRCDPAATGPDCSFDDSDCLPAPTRCVESCRPITPNGCDCFGCCELPARSGDWVDTQVFEGDGPGCTLDSASDPSACPPCTPRADCLNPCESCELCVGSAALPEGCAVQACPAGSEPCGQPGDPACPSGSWCLTGCCTTSEWWSGDE